MSKDDSAGLERLRTALQERATNASQRFKEPSRKPIVIEFSGTPRAGKTSTIRQIKSFLKRYGFKVRVIEEKASICPIRDKRHPSFNVWTATKTLADVLEFTQDPPTPEDPDIVLLDRGIFDAITWIYAMEDLDRISNASRDALEQFLLVEDWRQKISGVILMTANPEEALRRERGYLPVPQDNDGAIVNEDYLRKMLDAALRNKRVHGNKFKIYHVDTSAKGYDRERVVLEAADYTLGIIEENLAEEIAFVEKSDIVSLFCGSPVLAGDEGIKVLEFARRNSKFLPRNDVESDWGRVQFLPVAVIRNRRGELLQMKRKEKSAADTLHEEVVIWAGGHIRKEDTLNGDFVLHCVRRELLEELRLSVEKDELRYLGAIYHDVGGSTSKHAALVFEWQSDTDDVQINLSEFEFFERVGSSMSGRFVTESELRQYLSASRLEPWSDTIVKSLLPEGGSVAKSLFD